MNKHTTTLVETKNIKLATKTVLSTVESREIALISGKAGMGKTTFRNILMRRLEEEGHVVVFYLPFKETGTQTNSILTEIYSKLFPEQEIPHKKQKKLLEISKVVHGNSVILVIENTQNLDIQTVKEIKEFREFLDYQLSIIFFMKNDTKLLNLFSGTEIGQRTRKFTFKQMSNAETIKIATEVYGVRFEDEVVERRFITSCTGNPLTIKYYCSQIKEHEEFNGIATLGIVSEIDVQFIKLLLEEYNISIRDVQGRFKQEGKEVSVGFISNTVNGSTEIDSQSKGGVTTADITRKIRQMAEEKRKN